ncbi:MAG: type I restriction enzyme HsdR N-terminal domain-containing protein [Muribaculaceae bacterium]|nr:type I restriction enzyme HsdR N-terminal domain-containing protein [Muribaculaceae bacterium]
MQTLTALNLPADPHIRLARNEQGDNTIYDPLRSKWIIITPEEWVRQHFVAYLIGSLGYPASLMANEVSLQLNGTLRRCDTLVWDRHGAPLVIVEYKAPHIDITQKVFEQIARYNMVIRAPFLMVSNGLKHFCATIDHKKGNLRFLRELPRYESIAELIDQK